MLTQPTHQNVEPIIDDSTLNNWIFGVTTKAPTEVLQSDGQWLAYIPDFKLQRNSLFDSYGCVSFSALNCLEIIWNKRYGEKINKSDRKVIVGSGTDPKRGNSFNTVAEYIRTAWTVEEAQYPFTQTMTEQEFYKIIPQEVNDTALANLFVLDIYHADIQRKIGQITADIKQLKTALVVSPIQVAVSGSYTYNEKGYVEWNNLPYNHGVAIIGYVENEYWLIFDSENMIVEKFVWDYPFAFPKIYSVKKKFMPKVYKKVGESTLYMQLSVGLVPFADGVISGGELYKDLFGSYANIEILECLVLPPLANYSVTTQPYEQRISSN